MQERHNFIANALELGLSYTNPLIYDIDRATNSLKYIPDFVIPYHKIPFSLYNWYNRIPQIARFMGPTWGPPGSCQTQMGPMLAPSTLYQGLHAAHQWQSYQTGQTLDSLHEDVSLQTYILSTFMAFCELNPSVTAGFTTQCASNVETACSLCCQSEKAAELMISEPWCSCKITVMKDNKYFR